MEVKFVIYFFIIGILCVEVHSIFVEYDSGHIRPYYYSNLNESDKIVNSIPRNIPTDSPTLIPRKVTINGKNCFVTINEINTNTLDIKFKNNDFIEIKSFCDNKPSATTLQGFKIIGISTGTKTTDNLSVDLVITLWNEHTNDNTGMITFGGPDVTAADFKTPSSIINYSNKFQSETTTLFKFLNTGASKKLYAVAILYKEKDPLSQFVLTQKKPRIPLNPALKEIIKTNLVDLLVYGQKAPYDNCNLFLDLKPDYTNRKYVLREFDNKAKSIDYSLNRCTIDTRGFVPEQFKLGRITPAAENDCTGAHFILEDYLSEITAPLQTNILPMDVDVQPDSSAAGCSTSAISAQYINVRREDIDTKVDELTIAAATDQCSQINLNPQISNDANMLQRANAIKRRLSYTTNYAEDYDWLSEKYFR